MTLFYDPGDYVGVVAEQAWQETKAKDPMIVLNCSIVGRPGAEPGSIQPLSPVYERRVYIAFPSSSEMAQDISIRKLRHVGWQGNDFETLNLIGQEIPLRCTEGTYKGAPSEQWEIPLPGAALENKAAVAQKMNALFGRRLRQEAAMSGPPMPPPVAAPDGYEMEGDDDIPF